MFHRYRFCTTGGGYRTLEVSDSKIKHEHNYALTKLDVLNLFLSCYVLHKKSPIKLFASKGLKSINLLFEQHDRIIVSPSGANIGIYQDERLLALLFLAIRKKKEPIFYYCTIGKSRSHIFNFLAKRALKKCRLYVREKASVDYIHKLGLECKLGIDTAFSFNPVAGVETQEFDLKKGEYIVLILSELSSWHPHYLNSNVEGELINKIVCPTILELATRISKKIILLPHIVNQREQDFLNSISKNFDSDICSVADIDSVNQYNDIIKNSLLVVSMRYHGVVMAAKNCVPFVGIAYENKMFEVANYLSLPDSCISIEQILKDNDLFKRRCNDVYINSESIKRALADFNVSDYIHKIELPLDEMKL